MFRNQVTPLRSNVGNPIKISSVIVSNKSVKAQQAIINSFVLQNLSEAEQADYSPFFPDTFFISSQSNPFSPMNGATNYKLPPTSDFNFPVSSNAVWLAGLLNNMSPDPRDLSVEIEITLKEKKLIGGISYAGFSFLPYYLTEQGENSANYGLPREIKISWNDNKSGFIDDESSVTQEEPVSHSGIHYISIDPVKTDKIKIKFSDWPTIIKSSSVSGNDKLNLKLAYAFVLPFIVVYEHRESCHYAPHIPFGVLACLKNKDQLTDYFGFKKVSIDGMNVNEVSKLAINADYLYFINKSNVFCNLTCASITGQKRIFKPGTTNEYIEKFVSVPFDKKETIDLYLEQGEENSRCVAGLTLNFSALSPKFAPPDYGGTLKNPVMNIKVYEVDLPEGVSPLSLNFAFDSNKKYITLLFEDNFSANSALTCKFSRTSLSRYFLLRFLNIDKKRGQLCLDKIEMIQSAHVAITSRSSKIQRIEAINYRIIGEKLADDYAGLGEEGFSITVETLNAGNRKDVLFSADNLLTLLDSGNARLYANYRREEITTDVSEEIVTTHAGSKDIHSSSVNSSGWRRSETGKDVIWDDKFIIGGNSNTDISGLSNFNKGEFESYGNSENRNRTELISNEGAGNHKQFLKDFLNSIHVDANGPNGSDFKVDIEAIVADTDTAKLLIASDNFDWKTKAWKGFDTSADSLFRVGSIHSLTVPPFLGLLLNSAPDFNKIKQAVSNVSDKLNHPSFIIDLDQMSYLTEILGSFAVSILNGLNIGLNLSWTSCVGISGSFSSSGLLPHLDITSSTGSTGNIAKQANRTGYTYSQLLNFMFDNSRVITEFEESDMKRKVVRELNLPGTQKERKRGMEVMWQGKCLDIVTGKIPVGITLPATADKYYKTSDQAIRVRLGGNLALKNIEVDIWFDVSEENSKEDY
ncbi:MAG: hypothetical protein NTX61_13410 [Bacteroidetes bacterium]|nr:hypothetical protein [Bacteroidota bacterium]